jgi:hypothetical protein
MAKGQKTTKEPRILDKLRFDLHLRGLDGPRHWDSNYIIRPSEDNFKNRLWTVFPA